jgi:hypothetical protein
MDEGFCTYTVSNKDVTIDEENLYTLPDGRKVSWWEMRPYMIQVPWFSWVEIKTFIITMCQKHKQCGEVTDWERTVHTVDDRIPTPEALP